MVSPMYYTVLNTLKEVPETRGSDKKLIIEVYKRLGINTDMPFGDVLFSAPSIETITRCRRKAQERHDELQAKQTVRDERTKLMLDFEDFAVTY